MAEKTNLIAATINTNGLDYLNTIDQIISDNRLTLIDSTGKIIADNKINPQLLDNHLDRPEIAMAFSQGYGKAIRYSDSVTKQTLYYAVLLDNGMVIRLANTANNAWQTVIEGIPYMAFVSILMFIIAVIIAKTTNCTYC